MPSSDLHITVNSDTAGTRLDVLLAQQCPDVPSRTYIQRLISSGDVLVNGKVLKAGYRVEAGDEVHIVLKPLDMAPSVLPENIPLNIFYEDDDLLVVHKPAGMLTHPVRGQASGTLVNALLYHCTHLSDLNTPEDSDDEEDAALVRPGIVHRLDRETSGLLVVAKSNIAHARLAAAFERREVRKKYLALVKGRIEYDEGRIDEAIGRHPRYRDKKAVVPKGSGKSAVTAYRVLERFGDKATLLALYPQSGRTHQLRVHLAHIKHPILGDDKYGEARSFGRLALHAQGLGFVHPVNGKFLEFQTPVPQEFRSISKT